MIDGQTVSTLRRARGWTIRKLAEDTGVNYTVLSRIERGHRKGTWPQAVLIAAALDEPVLHILADPHAEPSGRTVHGNVKTQEVA